MNEGQKIVISLILFIITVGTGIWLTQRGRPLIALIFNVHKLIALASVVISVILFINMIKTAQPDVLIILLVILAALSAILLFVSGAILSSIKNSSRPLLVLHNMSAVLMPACSVVAVYLMKIL